MSREQRRGALSRQRWWRRPSCLIALAAITGWSLVAVGASPALARPAPHRNVATSAGTPQGFTYPARVARAHSACQPAMSNCPVPSTLWSGYEVTSFSTTYSSVSADWVQPRTSCPTGKVGKNAWSLFWVGLDGGNSSRTVEQGGSEAQCTKHKVHYYAWWEMFPTNAIQSAFPVFPGDHISSSVVYSATDDTYTVTVNDTTASHAHSLVVVASTDAAAVDPDTYTMTEDGVTTGPTTFGDPKNPQILCAESDPCENSSAEWIVEAPGDEDNNPQQLFPLAHFKPVVFQDANASDTVGNSGPISDSAWQYTALNLTNSSKSEVLAAVGGLTNGGQRFRDVWIRP